MTTEIFPWELWWSDFDPQVGGEQAGFRPAVVVGTIFACQVPNELALVFRRHRAILSTDEINGIKFVLRQLIDPR